MTERVAAGCPEILLLLQPSQIETVYSYALDLGARSWAYIFLVPYCTSKTLLVHSFANYLLD